MDFNLNLRFLAFSFLLLRARSGLWESSALTEVLGREFPCLFASEVENDCEI